MKLQKVKVGDKLTRMIGGMIAIEVVVGEVTDTTVKCGSADGLVPWEVGWTFDRETGAEIDEDLGWDGKTKTGSFIKL